MTNVLSYTVDTYFKRLGLLLLFSISFIIALVIPIFASFPTYSDLGGIFIRASSIFANLTAVSSAVIVASTLFSLLFLSFAIVSINAIVKHSRTHAKIRREVIEGIERYTGRVFVVLLIYTALLVVATLLTYSTGHSGIITAVVGLAFAPFFFYAPSSIVIDESGVVHSMKASLLFFFRRFDYFLLWIGIALLLVTFFDFLFITASGTLVSRYAMLVFDSLFILPFLVMLQSECYMKRFALLKR